MTWGDHLAKQWSLSFNTGIGKFKNCNKILTCWRLVEPSPMKLNHGVYVWPLVFLVNLLLDSSSPDLCRTFRSKQTHARIGRQISLLLTPSNIPEVHEVQCLQTEQTTNLHSKGLAS